MADLDEIFSNAPPKKQNADSGKPVKIEKICLLPDGKRAYNMSIMLSRLKKFSFTQLKDIIVNIDEKILTCDMAETLLNFVPMPDEKNICKNFDGDLDTIDVPSQYICTVFDIPRMDFRLKALVYKSEFEDKFN